MQLKIDFHVHTDKSRDGHTSLRQIPKILEQKQLHGLAITDHNVNTRTQFKGFISIPGIEYYTLEGHIVGLGELKPIEKKRGVIETIDMIHRSGGLAILPHPFDIVSSSVNPFKVAAYIDAIEVSNASAFQYFHTKKIREIAIKFGLAEIGGSDSHIPQTIGDAYTIVDVDNATVEAVLTSIKKRHTKVVPGVTSMYHRLLKIKKDLL